MVLVEGGDALYTRLRSVKSDPVKPPAKIVGRLVTPKIPVRTLTRQVDAFSLTFDSDRPLPAQGSYTVDHATLGRFVMFLVPGTSPSGSPTCSSVFTSFSEA